jgi:DNA-binding Xre family transcriptional regulator
MLTLHLAPIFKARGITNPYTFLVKAGFSRHTAHLLLHGNTRSLRLDHLEKLCVVLICELNDMIIWTPSNGQYLSEEHPLHNLKPAEPLQNIKETLDTLPFKQLKELTKQILKPE